MSRELFIANALSRHFSWSQNIMFVEDFHNSHLCAAKVDIKDRMCDGRKDSKSESGGENRGEGGAVSVEDCKEITQTQGRENAYNTSKSNVTPTVGSAGLDRTVSKQGLHSTDEDCVIEHSVRTAQ